MSGWENPAPSGSSAVQVLAQPSQGPGPWAKTGDLLETILATIAIPANTILPNGIILVHTTWQHIGAGATSPTIRARMGAAGSGLAGTLLAAVVGGAATPEAGEQIWIIGNANAANAQEGVNATGSNLLNLVGTSTRAIAAIDTTQATELNITGQLATAANVLTLRALLATVYPHA